MKIKKIKYENFRQFREAGEIECSVDGKVTIIYGLNGCGKTTLHQLCQWILYGKVKFNKTADEKALYNFETAKEASLNTEFHVRGALEFEHMGKNYELIRDYTYRKVNSREPSSKKVGERVVLQEKSGDNDWKPSENTTRELVERILPEALANYFFFDGETMITDLKERSSQSAKSIKKALISILDLELYQNALYHLHDMGYKSSVLGQLKGEQVTASKDSEIQRLHKESILAEKGLESKHQRILENQKKVDEKNRRCLEISQEIGSIKSKSEYERARKALIKSQETCQKNIDNIICDFGKTIKQNYTEYLVSKVGNRVPEIFEFKVSQKRIPQGLTERFVKYLLSEEVEQCICGRMLTESEKSIIRESLELFKPGDYTKAYNDYIIVAQERYKAFNNDKLEKLFINYWQEIDSETSWKKKIEELDEEAKNSPDIESLVTERQILTDKINDLNKETLRLSEEHGAEKRKNDARKAKYEKMLAEKGKNDIVQRKITIIAAVYNKIEKIIREKSDIYSKKLENNISDLIEEMLVDTVRSVTVDKDFSMKVFDSYNSQAKSEGQFAIVSFAYIGGIMKLIQGEDSLRWKEYPLVLDAPFSKLDDKNRHKVVNTIPKLAPQVIVFSKDNLDGIIDDDLVGNVYSIVSNEERNIAKVVGGCSW